MQERGLTLSIKISFGILAGVAAVCCLYLGWRLLARTWRASILPGGIILVSLFILHGLVVILMERGLAEIPARRAWRYRFSFLASFLLAILTCLGTFNYCMLSGDRVFDWVSAAGWLVVSWLGSFSGGLAATARREGLWEDNAPPAEAVQNAVLRLHRSATSQPGRSPFSKRLFDWIVSFLGLVLSSPVWLAGAFLIWLEDPGALLFIKNSVGRGGVNFRQFKLRTMVRGAEEATGPVMAQEDDTRILRTGRFLRKSHLDEIPQLLNILKGEMSVVGPRPQRTVLVYGYLLENPGYADRHQVLPGLAGLAQVTGSYFLTPHQKLRLDRLYIERMSLFLDLRLLLAAFLIAFWYRWRKGWNGRLPRWVLHGNT